MGVHRVSPTRKLICELYMFQSEPEDSVTRARGQHQAKRAERQPDVSRRTPYTVLEIIQARANGNLGQQWQLGEVRF